MKAMTVFGAQQSAPKRDYPVKQHPQAAAASPEQE